MHEVGMMQQILEMAVERAKQEGAQHINRVHMRVGAEAGVVPESLSFAFEVAKKDTIAKDSQLEVEEVPVLCYCASCGIKFHPADSLHECPECHQLYCDVRQGKEFELAFLDIS
jgi:hydrogenase nickel incorporation protein HypA/HybF